MSHDLAVLTSRDHLSSAFLTLLSSVMMNQIFINLNSSKGKAAILSALAVVALANSSPAQTSTHRIASSTAQPAAARELNAKEKEIKKLFEKEQQASQSGDVDKAFSLLNKLLTLQPQSHVLLLRRAEVYFTRNEFTKALKDVNEGLIEAPKDQDIWECKAKILVKTKEFSQALIAANKAVEFDSPQGVNSYQIRATVYESLKDYDKAAADYSSMLPRIKDGYKRLRGFLDRARCYTTLKKYDLALHDLGEAIKIQPDDSTAFRLRAKIYTLMNKKELAAKDFRSAKSIDDDLAPPDTMGQ